MEIIEVLRSRDPDAVERVIRRHNRAVQNQIRKEIETLGKM
jgi:DNA-binding FadR family transcriptional regulator